jgi:hypothetical protein
MRSLRTSRPMSPSAGTNVCPEAEGARVLSRSRRIMRPPSALRAPLVWVRLDPALALHKGRPPEP